METIDTAVGDGDAHGTAMRRLLRGLVASIAVTAAAAVLMAPSASAQETPIEMMPEPGTGHCDEACETHAAGWYIITQHVFGSEQEVTFCQDEFKGAIFEDGSGYTLNTNSHAVEPIDCPTTRCAEVNERFWRLWFPGEQAPGESHVEYDICYRAEGEGAMDIHCWGIELQVIQNGVGHVSRWEADDARGTISPGSVFCELTADWQFETMQHEGLEVEHL